MPAIVDKPIVLFFQTDRYSDTDYPVEYVDTSIHIIHSVEELIESLWNLTEHLTTYSQYFALICLNYADFLDFFDHAVPEAHGSYITLDHQEKAINMSWPDDEPEELTAKKELLLKQIQETLREKSIEHEAKINAKTAQLEREQLKQQYERLKKIFETKQ